MKLETAVVVSDFAHVEGGATWVAMQTALALAQKGLRVFFFTAVEPIDKQLIVSDVNIVSLGQTDILHNHNRFEAMKQGIYNAYAAKRFEELLKTLNRDSTIIHIHTWTKAISSSIFPVIKKMRFKAVITVHDYFLACPNGGFYNYKSKQICEIKPLSRSCIFCNCDSRHYYHKIWRTMRQIVQNRNIRSNTKLGYIFISDMSRTELKKRLDIPKNQFYLTNPIHFEKRVAVNAEKNELYLFIGRIAEEKGIRLFCKAVLKAGVEAAVIGDGPLRDELQKQFGNRILFTGWLDHTKIYEYLLQTRCLIFPSRWLETFAMTPLEVQAMGIPSIVPDRCCACEHVRNGKSGIVFHIGDLDDLVNKIKLLSNDIFTQKLSNYAFNTFNEETYSKSNYIEKLLKIYNEMLISPIWKDTLTEMN